MKTRHCDTCGEDWPADREFFYVAPDRKIGLMNKCKACFRETQAVASRRIVPASRQPHITDVIAPLLTTPTFFGLNLQ